MIRRQKSSQNSPLEGRNHHQQDQDYFHFPGEVDKNRYLNRFLYRDDNCYLLQQMTAFFFDGHHYQLVVHSFPPPLILLSIILLFLSFLSIFLLRLKFSLVKLVEKVIIHNSIVAVTSLLYDTSLTFKKKVGQKDQNIFP